MHKTTRFNLMYLFLAILGVFLLHDLWAGYQSVTPLAYSDFQKMVSEGQGQGSGDYRKRDSW